MTPTEQLGCVTYLFSLSQAHRHLTIADIERSVMAPISLQQTMIFWENGRVVAWSSWAWMSDAASERFLSGAAIRREDWRSGPNLWGIDVIAPFGHIAIVARAYQRNFRVPARWLRNKDGRRVVHHASPLAA